MSVGRRRVGPGRSETSQTALFASNRIRAPYSANATREDDTTKEADTTREADTTKEANTTKQAYTIKQIGFIIFDVTCFFSYLIFLILFDFSFAFSLVLYCRSRSPF